MFDGTRPNEDDRKKLIDELVVMTERLQDQNQRLLTQLEKVGTVAMQCEECNEKISSLLRKDDTTLRRHADASKELGSGDLG